LGLAALLGEGDARDEDEGDAKQTKAFHGVLLLDRGAPSTGHLSRYAKKPLRPDRRCHTPIPSCSASPRTRSMTRRILRSEIFNSLAISSLLYPSRRISRILRLSGRICARKCSSWSRKATSSSGPGSRDSSASTPLRPGSSWPASCVGSRLAAF